MASVDFRANRVDITGGRRSAYCASNCTIENSWVHAQGGDPDGEAHFSGIRMEQYTTLSGKPAALPEWSRAARPGVLRPGACQAGPLVLREVSS